MVENESEAGRNWSLGNERHPRRKAGLRQWLKEIKRRGQIQQPTQVKQLYVKKSDSKEKSINGGFRIVA